MILPVFLSNLYLYLDKATFDSVGSWIKEVKDLKGDDVILVLVGNKADLESQKRAVTKDEAKKVAEENKAIFFEVSAKRGEGISEMFTQIASNIVSIETGANKEAAVSNNWWRFDSPFFKNYVEKRH